MDQSSTAVSQELQTIFGEHYTHVDALIQNTSADTAYVVYCSPSESSNSQPLLLPFRNKDQSQCNTQRPSGYYIGSSNALAYAPFIPSECGIEERSLYNNLKNHFAADDSAKTFNHTLGRDINNIFDCYVAYKDRKQQQHIRSRVDPKRKFDLLQLNKSLAPPTIIKYVIS